MLYTGFSADILIFICVAFLFDANIYKIGIIINFSVFLHNLAKDDKIQTLITKRRNHILLSIFFTADFT